MSGARNLLVAALVAVLSLPWTSALTLAATLQADAGKAIENNPTRAPLGGPDTGGETMATATIIASLPFSDSDNTCGHVQDYTASCGANSAPDLFYRYVPAANHTLAVSVCGSGFDTILYVLENGIEIACNDDYCGLQSQIVVPVVAGRTYIIGVSGFSTACGLYTLNPAATPVEAMTWGAIKSVYRGESE